MVRFVFEAGTENGRYEVDTGEPYTDVEKMAAMGVFAKLVALVKQAPRITRTILVEINGASVDIKKEGDFVSDGEDALVRRQLAYVISQAERDLALG